MKLSVNGEEYETEEQTLSALLEELRVVPGRVAVEVNLKVIRRADFLGLRLREGDVIEIVNFVGGGQGKTVVSEGSRVINDGLLSTLLLQLYRTCGP